MNRFLAMALGVALSFAGCTSKGAQPPTDSPFDYTGFTFEEVPDMPGAQLARKVDGQGRLVEEGMLIDGKRNGLWIKYYVQKQLPKEIANFANDMYNGLFVQYTNYGQIEMLAHYRNNKLHGKYIKYRINRPVEEADYVDGVYHGWYRSYYDSNGKLQKEIHYQNGILHGLYRYYNEDGTLVMEYEYDQGEKVRGGLVQQQAVKEEASK